MIHALTLSYESFHRFYDGFYMSVLWGGVYTPTSWGHVTHVPVVYKTSFWYQKERKEILVTYFEDLNHRFSLKCQWSKKSAVVYPPPINP